MSDKKMKVNTSFDHPHFNVRLDDDFECPECGTITMGGFTRCMHCGYSGKPVNNQTVTLKDNN